MKQTPDCGKLRPSASRTRITARTITAVVMLLVLLAGGIAWPATASGPLCLLACCAGLAPHTAGSCMHGSCDAGVAKSIAGSVAPRSHHHHEPAQVPDSLNTSQVLGDVVAGACGSDMEEVLTIDASPTETPNDYGVEANPSKAGSDKNTIAATALSRACQTDCGACASGFSASGRSRNAAVLAASNKNPPLPSAKLTCGSNSLMLMRSALSRRQAPRGPPEFS